MSNFLEIKNLSVNYGDNAALSNINLDINKGEIVSVIGPNGSGKSTFIKSVLHLIKYKGNITLNGLPNFKVISKLSYMPQSENIDINFPINVRSVVEQSQFNRRKFNEEIVNWAISINELTNLQHKNLDELSGGELQRVFLARTLAQDGEVLLLDEPFSNMDITNQNNIIDILHKLKEKGKTVIITTHNLKMAQDISSSLVLLNKKLVSYGKPKDCLTKSNLLETFGEEVIFTNGENISITDHHSHTH
jgi:ABC-type Mn2+/Zn2+ transport system ATPase subunit